MYPFCTSNVPHMKDERETLKVPKWLMERIRKAAKKSKRKIIQEIANRFS